MSQIAASTTTTLPIVKTNSEIAREGNIKLRRPLVLRPIPRPKSRRDEPKKSIRQRLAHVCDEWDRLQESRKRDAVYRYLRAVFYIVKHYSSREKTEKLVRRAFKFAGLPVDMKADPFAVIIRCTSEQKIDRKTVSKWSRALRWVAKLKKPRHRLMRFMKINGGINACAERYTRYFGRAKR